MPNHTDNRVILSHEDSSKIDEIYNIMNTGAELCHSLVPEPRKSNGDPKDGWYDWRVKNWGTKWEIYDTSCERNGANELRISFLSAWSPPDGIFKELVNRGFEIDARYFDEGWMYIGWFLQEDGQLLDYCESDIDLAIATHPELDEEFGVTKLNQEYEEEIA